MNTAKLKLSELQSAIIRNPVTVSPMTIVSDAIAKMVKERSQCHLAHQGAITGYESGVSCVLVIENEKIVGILTERDIVRLISQATDLSELPIREVMTHPVITLRESSFTDLLSAIHVLQNQHIRNLPLVDDQDRLTGLLTHESLRHTLRPFDLLRLRLVSEVMNSSVTCAPPDRSMMAIAQQMAAKKVSCVVIVEPMLNNPSLQIPIGILTERDIVQFQSLELELNNCTAQVGMSKPIFGVSADASLWQVQQIMEQRLIRRLIVTGTQGELVGIVTQSSLLQVFNPLELYSLTEILEAKVAYLEAEKAALLQNQNVELERLVTERTASLLVTAEREKIVANIADRIRVSLNLPDILETCVTEVRDFLQCDRVIVYQFQEDWSGIIITESVEAGFSTSLGNHIRDSCFQDHSTYIYRQDQPILVNNIYTAGYSDCHVRLLEQYQVKANLVVPIRVSGQLWGLLIGHQCQSPRDWAVDDTQLLQNIAVQLAIAIQQANAYKQLQHELAEREKTERLFREAERIAKLGNWTLDLQTNTLYWSDEVFRIMELDPSKFTASYETFLSLIHPEDRDLVDQAYQQSLRDHLPYNVIHRLLLKDGQVKYVQEQCETFYDEDGAPILSQGTVQDITNLKQTELELAFLNNQLEVRVQERTAQLLAQEEQLRDFFDNANDLIQSVRLDDGKFEYVNQAWLNTLGYQQDDIKDLNIFDILHPNCQEHCRQLMSQMMINAAITLDQVELTLITKNKQTITVEGNINCRVELNANHQIQPVATRAILRDITIRKQIERDLQESRDKFQRLVNDIGEKFTIFSHTGPTGILTYASDGIENLCGLHKEDVLNQNWAKVINWHPEDVAIGNMYVQMMVEHQIDFHQFELRLTHLNGSQRTINVSQHPVYDNDGNLIAVEGIVEDITERKQIQQQIIETNRQLAISNAQLARATRLKDEFLANMSHELRTPLNAILGITEGLQESVFGALNQQQQKVLQTIEKSGNHLLELINDILDLAKIEAGKLTLEFDTTAIEPLSQASIMFVRQQAIQKNVQLQVNIATLLPLVWTNRQV